jgi:hypothetical protein
MSTNTSSISQEEVPNFNYEILMKYNKLRVTHVFTEDIEHIFSLYKTVKHFKGIHGSFIEKIDYMNSTGESFTVGSIYSFTWKNSFPVKILIEDIVETPTVKSLQLYAYDFEPHEFKFRITYTFHKSTTDNYTYYYFDSIFFTLQALSFHQVMLNNNDMKRLFMNFDSYISSDAVAVDQVESIIISVTIQKLWDVITDWKTFQQRVPIIADRVEYEKGNDRVMLMKLLYKGDRDEYFLKVLEYKINDYEGEYQLLLYSSNNSFSNQEMHFKLVSLGDNCLLVFKHVFTTYVKCSMLEEFSKNKREILVMLKKSFK